MTNTIELHGRLPDDQPCKLLLDPAKVILEIAADAGKWTALAETLVDPLVVDLSDGRVATLKGNYLAPGTHSVAGRGRAFALTRIGASQAFIGPRAFQDTDLVDGIICRPTNELIAQYYTAHRGHVRAPRNQVLDVNGLFSRSNETGEVIVDAVDSGRLTICEFEQDNLVVTLRVGISEATNAQGTKLDEKRFTKLSYKQSVSQNVALADLMALMNFFSFIVGDVISPIEINIESGSADKFKHRPRFDFHAHFRKPGETLDPKEALRCLISSPLDGETYKSCIQAWMARRREWMHSYNLGSESIARQRELSRHRYIDAATWFESIPLFYRGQKSGIPAKMIAHVAEVASATFQDGGVPVSEGRIRELLAPLRTPSLAMRLRAAITHIQGRFGAAALPVGAEALISKITRLRGLLAHGEDPFASEAGRDIHELTLLLETVCGLLTLSGLPWEFERLNHAHGHPMQHACGTLSAFQRMRANKVR